MKVLKSIKKVILILLCCIYFAFVICMTALLLNYNKYGVTEYDGNSVIIINDSISSPIYKKGDLVIVKATKLENIKPGDEIFSYKIDSKGNPSIDLGKVGQVYPDPNENAISYENGSTYSMDFVIGKADKTYKSIGTYLSIIESKWGFLLIVLVPSFLIFVYQVYALIVEIKYGEDEE